MLSPSSATRWELESNYRNYRLSLLSLKSCDQLLVAQGPKGQWPHFAPPSKCSRKVSKRWIMKSMKCDEALDSCSQKQKIALGKNWHFPILCPACCSLLSCLLIGAAGVARCFYHAGSAADAGSWVCGVSCGFQTAATVHPCHILSHLVPSCPSEIRRKPL